MTLQTAALGEFHDLRMPLITSPRSRRRQRPTDTYPSVTLPRLSYWVANPRGAGAAGRAVAVASHRLPGLGGGFVGHRRHIQQPDAQTHTCGDRRHPGGAHADLVRSP
jgi:hypothetical protein